MMTSHKKTVLIAGGGLAGLTAAVLLDELGYQVTLLEQKPILGGRAFSYTDRITGLTVDNGQHLMIGAYHHTWKFFERIGAKHKVETLIPTCIPLIDEHGKKNTLKIGTLPPPWNLVWGLTCFKGLSFRDKIRLISLIGPIRQMKEGAALPTNTPVLEWLKQHGQSNSAIQNFWEPLTLAVLNDAPNKTTADGLVQMILNCYFAERGDGFLVFPKVGLSDVFATPAQKYLELRGVHIRCGVGIKEIQMSNKAVHSFLLSDGTEMKADLFVSALPPWDLKRVLPAHFLETQSELSGIKDMLGSPVVAVNLFFEKPVMTERFVGLTNAQTHWFFNHGNHVAAIISGAHNLIGEDKQTILEIVLKDLHRVVHPVHQACPEPLDSARGKLLLKRVVEGPALSDAEWRSRRVHQVHTTIQKIQNATLSSSTGINNKRPTQKVLDNFYVVGDWTKTDLPATIESAVKSAFMMQRCLM